MNVLIISSASVNIDENYINIAKKISEFLATRKCDLIFGASHLSMMGVCYQEFIKRNRQVYAFTNDAYVDELPKIKEAKPIVLRTTFDLKKAMFEKSDLIVCLAGGIGTLSELLSYIEERRINEKKTPIIIYDENDFYKYLTLQLAQMKNEKFINDEIIKTFQIVNNFEEFKKNFNILSLKESIII